MNQPRRAPAVICRNVTKDYGQGESLIHALRGITVDIYPGELTLLVGPSGCGKSTLISILEATLNATGGELEVLGSSVSSLSKNAKSDFRAQHVGFVFQQFNLLPALTASENVAVPLVIQGQPRSLALARAAAVLDSVGMGDRIHSMPTKMSGGQQQRVAIARALVHEPHLLVCDEPTSAVDAKTGQTIMSLIRRLSLGSNRVTVVVTHDPRVFGFADRIITLEDGRVSDDRRVTPQDPLRGESQDVRCSVRHSVHASSGRSCDARLRGQLCDLVTEGSANQATSGHSPVESVRSSRCRQRFCRTCDGGKHAIDDCCRFESFRSRCRRLNTYRTGSSERRSGLRTGQASFDGRT